MTPRSSMSDRLTKAEAWIRGHEERCEERYAGIQAAVTGLREALEGWRRGAWALVVAVLSLAAAIIGSLLVLVYDLEPLRSAPTAAPVGEGALFAGGGPAPTSREAAR